MQSCGRPEDGKPDIVLLWALDLTYRNANRSLGLVSNGLIQTARNR